jgi:hypothetical protein
MQKPSGGRARRDGGAAAFAFVGPWYETRLRRDWVLNYFLVHENSSVIFRQDLQDFQE